MPIEMKQRQFNQDDPIAPFSTLGAEALHTAITHSGRRKDVLGLLTYTYGCLAPSSPKSAMMADLGQDADALVAYCSATKRTILSSFHRKRTDWNSYAEQLEWLTEGNPASVELLFIHLEGTASFPSTIRSTLIAVAEPMSISLQFAEFAAPRAGHFVEVTKSNAVTTLIHAPAYMSLNQIANVDFTNLSEMMRMSLSTSFTAFHNAVITEVEQVPIPLWKRYDGQQGWTCLPVLSNLARSLLQQARMDRFAEEGTRKDASGLGMKNSVVEYVQNPSLFPAQSTKQVVLDTAASLAAHGAFCAFCGNLGADKKCSGCHWETYCSVGHQKKDWPHHRDWCKQNRKVTAK